MLSVKNSQQWVVNNKVRRLQTNCKASLSLQIMQRENIMNKTLVDTNIPTVVVFTMMEVCKVVISIGISSIISSSIGSKISSVGEVYCLIDMFNVIIKHKIPKQCF